MYKKFFKRAVDILISLIALPFVLLVIVIFAPIIYLSDRGPVFYNAARRGKDGKEFKMFKLRSMVVNAPLMRNADGSAYSAADDPRVTKIGRFMRKTSIDEFPQFLNVLLGDMSLIGPRPTMLTTPYEELTELAKKRLLVRPGITGYNQAYFRNAVTADERRLNDVYYVDNLSFALDLKILFKTVETVLMRKNIHAAPDAKEEKQLTEVGGK